MPHGGRPFGAMGNRRRGRSVRDLASAQENTYIRGIDNDDYDSVDIGYGQGRLAKSHSLHFADVGLGGSARVMRQYVLGEEQGSDSDEIGVSAKQTALKHKEEQLVQSALARIHKAQEKGKKNVKLHEDELNALKRRRRRLKEEAKRKKDASSIKKESRRSGRMVTVSIPPEEPKARRSKRSRSPRRSLPSTISSESHFDDLNGAAYFPFDERITAASSRNKLTSNVQYSSHSQVLPSVPAYQAFNPNRHVSEGTHFAQVNNASNRALPDDETWLPSHSKRGRFSADPFNYEECSDNEGNRISLSRRNASGPANMQFSQTAKQQGYLSSPLRTDRSYGDRRVMSSLRDPSLVHRQTPHRVVVEITDDEASHEETGSDDSSDDSVILEEPPLKCVDREYSSGVVPRKPVGSGITMKKRGVRQG